MLEPIYYLNYQCRPGDYLLVRAAALSRQEAMQRFVQWSAQAAVRVWEDEGGAIKPAIR